ncbi:hypothetical protein GCM10011342_17310 [Aquisalinus flavus]|uniref:Uncharacterized protein n=2 Tax=Aquisalinus flavus TaxID=1526572 RepID=A0A8J2Y6Y7_9PROT|nr:hypothetical protein GCM10011342_17310 [Aquisalinus flavus]
MKTHTELEPEDRQLIAAIARDRADDPAPPLGEAAMARIMAQLPDAAAPAGAREERSAAAPAWQRKGLSAITGFFRPPAWQAFAAAGVAGIIAGAVLPSVSPVGEGVTPEEQFAIYLQSDDILATLLEEDL